MKLLPSCACVLLLFPAGIAAAQTSPLTLEERPAQEPRQYFGGRKVDLSFPMLSSRDLTCEIRFRLFQLAKDLGAPLSPLSPIDGNSVFRADVLSRVTVPLLLPAVRVKTPVVLKLEIREKGGTQWLPSGQVSLLIHPQENLAAEALQKSASDLADGGLSLVVFGQDPFFPDLLTELKIPFKSVADFDSVPRGTAEVCLGRGDDWNLPPSATRQKKLVRLLSDITHPEGLFVVAHPESFEAKINLFHPETLSKPARWDLLAELFLQLQQIASPSPEKTTP